jgi:hypothetical protein
MRKHIILFIVTLGIFACEESELPNTSQDVVVYSSYKIFRDGTNFLENKILLADVSLSSISFFNGRFSQLNEYRGSAEIWVDSLHTISVNAGDVIIGGTGPLSAIPNSDSSYWVYETDNYSGTTPPYDLNFGTTQRWYIQGNSGAGISEVDINL